MSVATFASSLLDQLKRAPDLPSRIILADIARCDEGSNSERFHAVVARLCRAGYDLVALECLFRRYPDGMAVKYIKENRLPEEIIRSRDKAMSPESALGTPIEGTGGRAYLPPGYKVTPDGLYKGEKRVTAQRLYVMDLCSNSKQEVFVEFLFQAPSISGGIVWREALGDYKKMLANLTKRGAAVQDREYVQYIKDAIHMLQQRTQESTVITDCFGWRGSDFIAGDKVYRAGGSTETAIITASLAERARRIRTGGSYEDWQRAALSTATPGFEAQLCAILASLGAPFLSLLAPQEGGFVLSFTGSESGTGKSTALAAATSIWGEPKCLDMSCATNNARFKILATYKHLPVTIDEFDQGDPNYAVQFLQTFTNGSDKERLHPDGTPVNAGGSWSTALLTASNRNPVACVMAAEHSQAQAMRIVELQMRNKIERALCVKEDFERNFGFAGPMLMEHVLSDPARLARIEQELKEAYNQLLLSNQWSSDRRFQARALAIFYVTARLANELSIIEFDRQRVLTWALDQIKHVATVNMIRSDPQNELARYVSSDLRAFVVNHGGGRVEIPPLMQAARGRFDKETGALALDIMQLQKWLHSHANMSYTELLRTLEEQGKLLDSSAAVNLFAGTPAPPVRTTCLLVKYEPAKPRLVVDNDSRRTSDGHSGSSG